MGRFDQSTVEYKPGLELDVIGSGDAASPAILLIHGGGWFQGSRTKDVPLAQRLAAHGFVVFVPDYRLVPQHRFPAARTDVLDALAWAKASSTAFDRTRIAAWGGSAGGNLSVEVALATGIPAVSWSGLLDLEGAIQDTDAESIEPPTDPDFGKAASATINQTGPDDAFLRWCILNLVGGDRSKLADASPMSRVTARSGPVFMANSIDEFVHVDDATRMQRALCSAGVSSLVQLVPGKAHAEGYADKVFATSLAFVRDALGLPPAT